MKRLLFVLGLVAVLCATGLTAHAGGGNSAVCTNSNTPDERHLIDSPVSISFEAANGPIGPYITVCYSDTPTTDPNSNVAGGFVHVRVNPNTGEVILWCDGDSALVTVDCYAGPHLTSVGTNSLCVMRTGGTCIVSVPAPYVYTGTAPAPTLTVTILGTPTTVNIDSTCFGYCP